ncbi:MAG: NADH oxidase [Alphaproteobacteria bacterium CG_4_10_14_0_2_um_filter_63_37]|nr:MAG: hypothetical protein AUJ55_09105 [Proteobacteria bacterium CG1_02_64_396]PJA24321.1 MAG: NADH oxidase [Alphaproteobacteria bacterium CG_4_10_14_0_2_um_filter_63_37]
MSQNSRVVVIGGVAAGMSAASQLKRLRPEVEVTVLEAGGDVSYGACGMPYVLENRGDMESQIVVTAEQFRQERHIDVRLHTRALKIDRLVQVVTAQTPNGEAAFPYDQLLIATGARPVIPPLPGIDLPGVRPLKALEDGRWWSAQIREAQRVVIVGGGYIGLEMAQALQARGLSVTVVEQAPRLIARWSEAASTAALRALEGRGIKVRCDVSVAAIEGEGKVEAVVLSGGERLLADRVLLAIGVRPNSELAADAGLTLGPAGAIITDHACRTSDAHIFAAGDCATAPHRITGQPAWIPLGSTANKQGKTAGEAMAGQEAGFAGIVGTAIFETCGQVFATTGLSVAQAQEAGFDPVAATVLGATQAHGMPHPGRTSVTLIADRSGRLLGAEIYGDEGVKGRIDTVAALLGVGGTVTDLGDTDLAYCPPQSPVWDPLLIAAHKVAQKIGG